MTIGNLFIYTSLPGETVTLMIEMLPSPARSIFCT